MKRDPVNLTAFEREGLEVATRTNHPTVVPPLEKLHATFQVQDVDERSSGGDDPLQSIGRDVSVVV